MAVRVNKTSTNRAFSGFPNRSNTFFNAESSLQYRVSVQSKIIFCGEGLCSFHPDVHSFIGFTNEDCNVIKKGEETKSVALAITFCSVSANIKFNTRA